MPNGFTSGKNFPLPRTYKFFKKIMQNGYYEKTRCGYQKFPVPNKLVFFSMNF